MAAPPKVFISHTTQDKRDLAMAQTLAKGLQAGGADVWIAPDRIPSGSQWEREIVEAILKCSHFVVILSSASITAGWVQREIELARERYEIDKTFQILPLLVGKIGAYPNEDFLSQFQNLKYFDNPDDQLREIAKVLQVVAIPWVDYLKNVVRELSMISLVPGQKSVPIGRIGPIRVARLAKNQGGDPAVESYDIAKLPELASKVVLVGPGGCGKTTALRWLAYRLAIELLESNVDQVNYSNRVDPIPVLVNLGGYANSLLDLIQQTLINRGAAADENEIRSRIRQGKILVLLDAFDEVTNKRKLVSDLQELTGSRP